MQNGTLKVHKASSLVWTPLAEEFQTAGLRRRDFSAMALALWNIFPPVVRSASTFLAFQKTLKLDSDS